jgi:hypothetical protein
MLIIGIAGGTGSEKNYRGSLIYELPDTEVGIIHRILITKRTHLLTNASILIILALDFCVAW